MKLTEYDCGRKSYGHIPGIEVSKKAIIHSYSDFVAGRDLVGDKVGFTR